MTRRIVRTAIQLALIISVILITILFLDNRYRLLPTSIHNALPAHHPGLVITDIQVKTCSTLNPLSSCRLDPEKWHRIEKDLYLNTGWVSAAYVHIKRKKEEELGAKDRVVVDVKVGRLDPSVQEKGQAGEKWEARPAGVWLKRSAKRHESDSGKAVTAVDVLFGADATEPRPGWSLLDPALFLDSSDRIPEARLTVRRGAPMSVERPTVRVRKDGKFKILQVADLHLSTGIGKCRDPEPKDGGRCDADPRTLEFVAKVLDDEKPDLVVLSGDQVNGDTAPDAQSAIYKFASLLIHHKIPYATIYGNHDDEKTPLSRAAQMSLTSTLPYSLSRAGPASISGTGNYYIEILAPGTSTHSAITLYLLDSHAYSPDEKQYKGYDWIKPDQIKWFRETSRVNKVRHKSYTKIHLDMAFIHIPLPEYADASHHFVGEWREGVTAPGFNTHFRDALVEEGVSVVSCGHDHVNDYCALDTNGQGKEGRPELWMCYAGGAGFGGYGGYGGYHRRVRVFEIDANEARIRTWKRVEWGNVRDRIDEQVIVDGGHAVGP